MSNKAALTLLSRNVDRKRDDVSEFRSIVPYLEILEDGDKSWGGHCASVAVRILAASVLLCKRTVLKS
jgi:hypothetical protein